MAKSYFTRELFRFLSELEANNEKQWWEGNKGRYLRVIREPALELITDLAPVLAGISKHLVADPRPVGGSLIRPYRDLRFTRDGPPYKTNVGIRFRHRSSGAAHAPGFYLHLEPKACFVGAGTWRPTPGVARLIRESIHADPGAWEAATSFPGSPGPWTLDRDPERMLRRIPSDLAGDHARVDDLRLKSFTASSRLTHSQVTAAGFAQHLASMLSAGGPFVSFLCRPIGIPF